MKVSAFARSEPRAFASLKPWLAAAALAAYVAAHLPLLAPSLEDIDSLNFALGLRDYDVAAHQPHPPGYPLYIAMGRLSLAAVNGAAPNLDRVRAEALALAIWSALASAAAVAGAFAVYRACAAGGSMAAAMLLAVAPLFVVSSLRPMSDVPGLAAALVTQALLLRSAADARYLVAGAFAAGAVAGLRIQTIWLTLPVLGYALYRRRSEPFSSVSTASVAATVGVLVWGIPMIVATGGVDDYLRAVGFQAQEDVTVVDLLWTNPTPRRLAFSLYETFVMPWGSLSLAIVVGVAAVAGAIETAAYHRRVLGLMAIAFAPYVLFHLLFHETVHVRYALPVLVPVVWLAARGLSRSGKLARALQTAVALFAAGVAVQGARVYAAQGHPAFRAIAEMAAAVPAEQPQAVFSHYALRRPLQLSAPAGVRIVEPPPTREWVDLIDYWRNGGTGRVWFLADARRTDLALVDPQSRRQVTRYDWRAARRSEVSGTRPGSVDWYRFDTPGWFAGGGWSLTPELGGMARTAADGVDKRPIEAMVRRRAGGAIAVVGARHLATESGGTVVFSFAVDGRVLDEWPLDPSKGPNVLRVLQLPEGTLAGEGMYARITIEAAPVDPATPTPPVAIRQFDIQSDTGLVHAFDEGWHEEEYDNATGLRWRWTSERSVLRVVPSQAVRLRMRGESPLHYFSAPPAVRVTVAGRTIAEFRPDDDFDWTITVPSNDVAEGDGRIAIETDPVYRPALAERSSDERRLGLRLYEIQVDQVLP